LAGEELLEALDLTGNSGVESLSAVAEELVEGCSGLRDNTLEDGTLGDAVAIAGVKNGGSEDFEVILVLGNGGISLESPLLSLIGERSAEASDFSGPCGAEV
jgi:hypothetical protein